MSLMQLGAARVARRQGRRSGEAKATPPTPLPRYLKTGIETVAVMALFLILAGVALCLRARLGFVL
jgi:hypothetical protein